mmetsp:Transcript_12022/g.33801  ORF Transcript_12022/g.33801 Transcript_12022/m.33801 type:complete len:599 (+) Transcript_12022:581-2377(+)
MLSKYSFVAATASGTAGHVSAAASTATAGKPLSPTDASNSLASTSKRVPVCCSWAQHPRAVLLHKQLSSSTSLRGRNVGQGRGLMSSSSLVKCRAYNSGRPGNGGVRGRQQRMEEELDEAGRDGGRVMPMRRQTVRGGSNTAGRKMQTLPPGRTGQADVGIQVRRSDVMSKQIITRVEGSRLGKVVNLWVDTRTWEVISLDCVPPSNALKEIVDKALMGNDIYSVLLGSLRQIGDVVLVQDSTALELEDYSYGYRDLVAMDIRSQNGQMLGKVRDFMFSPDNGRLSELVFDMFGSPSVPPSAVSTFSIGVDQVIRVEPSQITVVDGYQAQQLSRGFLDNLFESAGRQLSELFDEPGYEEVSDKSYEQRLAEWRESVRLYEQQYGPVPQEVQQQASAALERSPRAEGGRQQQAGVRRNVASGRSQRARDQPAAAPQASQPSSSQSASVPIISRRQRQSYEMRDADGGLGEVPAPGRRPSEREAGKNGSDYSSSRGVPISDWLTEDERRAEREELLTAAYYGNQPVASSPQETLRFNGSGGGAGADGGWTAPEYREPAAGSFDDGAAVGRGLSYPPSEGEAYGTPQRRQRRGAARRRGDE